MLRERRILITGGARGLGRAFAQAAITAGARVAVADILEDAGRTTASEIGAVFVPLDLTSRASIDACVKAAATALDGLDGLINNGAITSSGGKTLEEAGSRNVGLRDGGQRPRHLARHAHRAALFAQLAPWTRREHRLRYRPVGCAAASGLRGEQRRSHCDDQVDGEGTRRRRNHRQRNRAWTDCSVEATECVPEDRHQLYAGGRALNRTQVPADVCGTVIYLLSDAAAFVTGQLLAVNGGFVMH